MSKEGKSRRVKLIANPGAGKANESAHQLKLAVDCLKKHHFKVDVALAHPKEEATPIARRAVKDGYKVVVAMGGDGTIEAVMRGLIGSKARLGILPTGTQNNIAKSLSIPEELDKACKLIATDNVFKLDVGQVKTSQGKKFIFFELATIGLSAALYPDLNKASNGKLSSVIDSARTFLQQDTRPKVRLTMNDESKVKVKTMLVVVSNTPVFGKNFKVAPEASMRDGLLDISVYPDFSKAELLRYYAAVMDAGDSSDDKVQHYQARKVKVKTSPKLDVMADGVILGKGKVKIKVRPEALRVITRIKRAGLEVSPASAVQAPQAEAPVSGADGSQPASPAIPLG